MFTAWIKGLYQQVLADGGETYRGPHGGSLKAGRVLTGGKETGGAGEKENMDSSGSELQGEAGGVGY